jgi:ankyrin repeat protein
VACKNGNLNVVKLLITQGCNPFIRSATDHKSHDTESLESNLQVAARWGHIEIVRYLLENGRESFNPTGSRQWSRLELREAHDIEGIPIMIKQLIKTRYNEIYGTSIHCAGLCIFIQRLFTCWR